MWIILSLAASTLWGMTYVLYEQIYKKISVFSSLSIACLFAFIVSLIASYVAGDLNADLLTILSSKRVISLVVAGSVTSTAAELLIGMSISRKSAALAGLIEISYPLFIALFATLLFKEPRPSSTTFIGGLLILSGVFLISYFNR